MAGSTPFRNQAAADRFRTAIRGVMEMAAPVESDRQATFYYKPVVTVTGAGQVDSEGTPFAPTTAVSRAPRKTVKVPVGVEFFAATAGNLTSVGEFEADRVVITLLDRDYAKVVGPASPDGVGFEFVVISGVRYKFERELMERALGSVGIHQIRCEAVD